MIFPIKYTDLAQAAVISFGRRSSSARGAELAAALTQLQALYGDGAFLRRVVRVQFCFVAAPYATDHAHYEQEILLGHDLQERHDAQLEHQHQHQHARDRPHEEELGAQQEPEEIVVEIVNEDRRRQEHDRRAEDSLGGDHGQNRHHQQRQHRVHGDLFSARAPAARITQPLPDGHTSSSTGSGPSR